MKHHPKFARSLFVIAALLFAFSGVAMSQETTGSIVGTVKDANGAAVANATITVTDIAKKVVVRTVQSNEDGQYTGYYPATSADAIVGGRVRRRCGHPRRQTTNSDVVRFLIHRLRITPWHGSRAKPGPARARPQLCMLICQATLLEYKLTSASLLVAANPPKTAATWAPRQPRHWQPRQPRHWQPRQLRRRQPSCQCLGLRDPRYQELAKIWRSRDEVPTLCPLLSQVCF